MSRPRGFSQLAARWGVGRHRRPDPPVRVTVVLRDGRENVLPTDSAISRAMGQVAALLAHW
ncbi:MAG: hypothetical protein ABI807_07950 [Sporichthyaceae bacterium]